ncbi:transglycosylase SLT domain-containing protein [Teichococcus oryzae]|uniref:Lytic transglycosylase domain-containing protein n=1 Tax=Teichococcus oryzae TaxID=1608942 RepID=A0A5B2TAS3_9PROT|nr:transglycosylase SLT domain-containing protein [Pseudoroseomonas oryzae]KAA2211612.1 lytic transglycosylase domain-containing protein [Pseudoroseomonas oryzae]
MTNNTCAAALPGATSASLYAVLPSLKTCLFPIAFAASMLLLLAGASQAEAAQARSGAAIQKTKASAPRMTARKPVLQRKEGTARTAVRRSNSRRPPTAPRKAQEPRVPSQRHIAEQKRDVVEIALQRAERATGLSADVLRRIAERESRLDPRAENPSSSARGLMQFTRDTWLEVVRDFGPHHGLGRYAAALTTDRDGNIGARNWRELQGILRLRDNPHLSVVLAAERLKKARPGLEKSMGRAARPADLYLVHLLGPTGARRFLAALHETPGRSSVAVVGEAAKPNPGVFERRGRALPVKTVYEEVAEMFEPRLAQSGNSTHKPVPSVMIADAE